MKPTDIRKKRAELLLAELEDPKPGWYYISMVHTESGEFRGGMFIRADGPHDAMCRMHDLGLYEAGCETVTPPEPALEEEIERRVPQTMRFVKLTKAELEMIDKE